MKTITEKTASQRAGKDQEYPAITLGNFIHYGQGILKEGARELRGGRGV